MDRSEEIPEEGVVRRPTRQTPPLRVYLCGPIAKNCWRHKVPELRDAFSGDERPRESARHDVYTALPTITTGVVCVGPWFVGCDHGCAHGRSTHGTEGNGCLRDTLGEQHRDDVFQANVTRIRGADAVFAYIDRKEAYGSAFEFGLAKALGKPIFIGFPAKGRWRDDMWFAATAGLGGPAGHVGSVELLWTKFCRILGVGKGMKVELSTSKKCCGDAQRLRLNVRKPKRP